MHPFADINPVMSIVAYGVVIILCLVLNLMAARLAEFFSTVLFLDTVGTATAAFLCGPWVGAVVGLLTNVTIGALLFRGYFAFWYVNVACGFIWGYLAHGFLPTTSEIQLTLFILAAGAIVGIASSILSTPLRIRNAFNTDHLLDKISRPLSTTKPWPLGWFKIFCAELLLSDLPDKLISTLTGIMVGLEVTNLIEMVQQRPLSGSSNFASLYHETVEFFAAYYYVALAIVVKALGVDITGAPGVSPSQQQLFALLGPLGIFGLLLGFPILLKVAAAILLLVVGAPGVP